MIGERIKLIRESQKISQKDFSDKINISLRTLQTYEQGKVEAVPFPVLHDIAKNFHVNLKWLFFGEGLMFDVLNQQLQTQPYYSEALSIAENEKEIEDCLKDFTRKKILKKIFPKSEKFLDQMLNVIFPKTQRMILFLYRILKFIEHDSQKIQSNYKEFLISKVQNFDLVSIHNIGHGFTSWDKNKLTSAIENLTEDECRIILENVSKSIDDLRESLDFLNKLTY